MYKRQHKDDAGNDTIDEFKGIVDLAMRDSTPGHDVGGMIHTAYPDGVLTFDVVLEMAMSHVLNYSTDSDNRHAELAQLLRTARTLQRRIALCNSDSSELIDAALRKGIDIDADIRGTLRRVDELEKDLTTHHIYVLAAFVSPLPAR